METRDYSTYMDKIINAKVIKKDYTLETIAMAPETEKIGMQIIIARTDSKGIDQLHANNLIYITDALGLELNSETKQDSKTIEEADYKGENWSVHKPLIPYKRYIETPYAIPAQIHINNTIHLYILDNPQTNMKIRGDLFSYDVEKNFTKMNIGKYGNLLMNLTNKHKILQLKKLYKNNESAQKIFQEIFSKETPKIIEKLRETYNQANRDIEEFTDFISR